MNKALKILLIAVLALTLWPAVTEAQHGDNQTQMNRLERELEITDEVIRKAQEEIGADGNALAVAALSGATQQQEWARGQQDELRRRFQQQRYQGAMTATLKAREKAGSALANFRRLEQYDGIVLRDLERARDLLDRARELMTASDHPGLKATIRSADNNLKQAWEFYRNGRLRPAYKLAGQVEKASRKVLERANAELRKRGVYERRHLRVGEYMNLVRQMLEECSSDEAQALMLRAQSAFSLAEESESGDHPGLAIKQLQLARDLASKAEHRCQGAGSLSGLYERLMAEMDRLQEVFADNMSVQDSEAIQTMLDQAEEQLNQSKTLLDDQQYESAAISLKAAQLALRQARKLLERNP